MNFPGIDVLMTYNPCMVTADTSPATARNLMDQYSLRHLPVVDSERRLIGIVSDVDLAPLSRPQMAMASVGTSHSTGPSQQDQTHVEEIMTESVVVITPADSPGHAVRIGYVVEDVVGDDGIEGAIGEGELLRVGDAGRQTHGVQPRRALAEQFGDHISSDAGRGQFLQTTGNLAVAGADLEEPESAVRPECLQEEIDIPRDGECL